jgi:hypothetical protein
MAQPFQILSLKEKKKEREKEKEKKKKERFRHSSSLFRFTKFASLLGLFSLHQGKIKKFISKI